MLNLQRRICLAVPVYNEGPLIADSIEAFLSESCFYTLLIVNDGSNEEDSNLLNKLANSLNFNLINHGENRGYGAACKSAAKWAHDNSYEWIIFADSDLTNPVNEITHLASILGSESVDIYKANRFGSSYGMKKVKYFRRLLSRVASLITTSLIANNIADPTNGFRAIKCQAYSEFNLSSNDFSIILEEVTEYLRLGLKVSNFDSILGSRSQVQKPSNFQYSIRLLLRYSIWTLKCAVIRSRRIIKRP